MRFIFKTDYRQDIKLFRHRGYVWSYGVLILVTLLAPLILTDFQVGELSQTMIFAIAGVGLMLLVGFTGQVSLGHAAFLGVGAYIQAWMISHGVPFVFSIIISGVLTGVIGIILAVPMLRMTGIYLAIGTLALSVVIEQVLKSWKTVTGGFDGLPVKAASIFGYEFTTGKTDFYYLCWFVLLLVILLGINLLRSPTGRAMVAVRDSEVSARSMGVNVSRTKIIAFGVSAAITGVAGAMYAHSAEHLAPDGFGIILSIQLLLMIVIGGLGSLQGAVLGALVVVLLPQGISISKEFLPDSIANLPGLEAGVFGFLLVVFILFEPLGIYGRYRKIKLFFDIFPLYRKATFRRQRAYQKTERMR
jgi:branched-chain amino acid transport system permease protein